MDLKPFSKPPPSAPSSSSRRKVANESNDSLISIISSFGALERLISHLSMLIGRDALRYLIFVHLSRQLHHLWHNIMKGGNFFHTGEEIYADEPAGQHIYGGIDHLQVSLKSFDIQILSQFTRPLASRRHRANNHRIDYQIPTKQNEAS